VDARHNVVVVNCYDALRNPVPDSPTPPAPPSRTGEAAGHHAAGALPFAAPAPAPAPAPASALARVLVGREIPPRATTLREDELVRRAAASSEGRESEVVGNRVAS
jgi:hypothetical protein